MVELSQGSKSTKVPLVTVIIPAYNTENYIAEAIRSVLKQTIQDVEVIVVDDASTDNTARVAETIGDPRVKVIRLSENGGAAVARNHAIDKAQGVWVAVLDSDDWYAPDRLETLLKVAAEYEADMVADDLFYTEGPNATPWITHIQRSGEEINEPIVIDPSDYVRTDIPAKRGLHLGFSKVLMKRDFLNKFNIRYEDQIRLGQDFFIYLYALACGAKFVLYPKPYYFYRYRVRPDSLVLKSQLSRLEQTCWGIQLFLEREVVRSNPSLVKALNYKLGFCRRLRAYYRVAEPLKNGSIRQAISAMFQNPYFFIRFLTQIPRLVTSRLSPTSQTVLPHPNVGS
ncbi:MAG: glycosyltransferase family 2 protein [Leptolyngbyaceae bacterium]|nr:glycosyltransferase family 2 protein [Leptolyngbyaceae bacterium]